MNDEKIRDLEGRAELGRRAAETLSEDHPTVIAARRARNEALTELEKLPLNSTPDMVVRHWMKWKMLTEALKPLKDMAQDGRMAQAELDREAQNADREKQRKPPERV